MNQNRMQELQDLFDEEYTAYFQAHSDDPMEYDDWFAGMSGMLDDEREELIELEKLHFKK